VVSFHRRPLSNASNSDSGIEGVGMVVMGSRQQIEVLAAIKVAMVFMASNGSYGMPVAAVLEIIFYFRTI